MARIALLPLGLVFALLFGCAQPPQPTMLPLQVQSLQTREYEVGKDVVFPSVISVLQDLGYTVTNADKDTGLISAESAAQSNPASFWWGYTDVAQTKATGFVETVGDVTRVRLNFVEVRTKSSSYGQQDRQDTPILDAVIYRNAFDRIESAIFFRSG